MGTMVRYSDLLLHMLLALVNMQLVSRIIQI